MLEFPRSSPQTGPDARPARLPYRAPQLTEFGTLRDITLAVGMNGMPDGGGRGMMRTRV